MAPLAVAVTLAWAEPPLQPSTSLSSSPRGESAQQRPMFLEADELHMRPDLDETAPAGRVHRYASYLWTTVDATADATVDVRRPSEAPT